jgi:hypothetical protein
LHPATVGVITSGTVFRICNGASLVVLQLMQLHLRRLQWRVAGAMFDLVTGLPGMDVVRPQRVD